MKTDFDKISKWYDNPLNQIYFKLLYKKAISYIDKIIRPDDRFLDIACGTGNWLILLEKKYRLDLFGLDNSQGMLNQVVRKSSNIDLVEGSAESLPYRNGDFNFVSIVESFHHFKDHDKALSEAHRVLSNKGQLLIVDPSLNGLSKIIWQGTKIFYFERESKYFYFNQLAARVQMAGFDIVKSKIEFGNNWILAQKK